MTAGDMNSFKNLTTKISKIINGTEIRRSYTSAREYDGPFFSIMKSEHGLTQALIADHVEVYKKEFRDVFIIGSYVNIPRIFVENFPRSKIAIIRNSPS